MAVGQHLKLRCFLEGVEVPTISASLAIQANAPAQCQIQIPATDKAHELLPRTLVHVFFRDYYVGPGDNFSVRTEPEQASTREDQVASEHQADEVARERQDEVAESTAGAKPEITDSGAAVRRSTITGDDTSVPRPGQPISDKPEAAQADTGDAHAGPIQASKNIDKSEDGEEEDRRWKLFFCGEVIGYQFVKNANSRSIILQCLDPSVYWDTCYQYKVSTARLTGDGMAAFVGAGTTLFDEFYESSTSILVGILNRNSISRPELTGMLAGVVHLLERVGGVYTSRGIKGVNDFFSLAELRLHLVDMITASERDESSRRLCARRAYNRFMRRAGGRLGKISSFREMLAMINRFIFHDVYPNPIAMYQPAGERAETRTHSRTDTAATTESQETISFIFSRLTALVVEAQGQARAGNNASASNLAATYAGLCQQLGSELRRRRGRYDGDPGLAGGAAMRASRHYSANQRSRGDTQIRRAHQIIQRTRMSLTGTPDITRSWTSTRTVNTTPRLNMQIIRPDVWMVSPPRCNVIWPELYNSVSYSRQFMREVSRMQLTVTDEIFGSDALLNQWYYAPNVEVLGERMSQVRGQGATLPQAAYSRRLMDHELYTGVVPVFERLNEVNIYAARSDQVAERGARVPYVVRASHFQFFKHRFTPRTISVSGKFNPYAVAGFPCVVIDKYMTEEQVLASGLRGVELLESLDSQRDQLEAHQQENLPDISSEVVSAVQELGEAGANLSSLTSSDDFWTALRLASPTQLTGMIVGLNHTITQMSAQTSYQIQYGRTHRENDELLGANRVRLGRRDEGTATRTTTVAALAGEPPQNGQMGPYFGTITNVTPVERTGSFLLFGTFLPQGVRDRGRRRSREARVPVGVSQPARNYPAEVLRQVPSPETEVEFTAYDIEEEVERYRGDIVDIPFEDFVRPPWMSDVWKNDRIGAAYLQMLGTGSVTDDLVVHTGAEGAPMGSASADLETPIENADAAARNEQDPTDWQRASGGTTQGAAMRVRVERAIDLLVRSYSEIRHEGLDVTEFARGYSWRPIADMIQMLGSRDLEVNPETGKTIRGEMGFHSLAFGHGPMGQNIRNLLRGEDARRILGIGTGADQDRANLLSRLDKRADKSARVLAYVRELWADRGQLG